MEVIILSPMRIEGIHYGPGSRALVTDQFAREQTTRGRVKPAPPPAPEPSDPAPASRTHHTRRAQSRKPA